eukprot:3157743-Prymnesium_polylepis.1
MVPWGFSQLSSCASYPRGDVCAMRCGVTSRSIRLRLSFCLGRGTRGPVGATIRHHAAMYTAYGLYRVRFFAA